MGRGTRIICHNHFCAGQVTEGIGSHLQQRPGVLQRARPALGYRGALLHVLSQDQRDRATKVRGSGNVPQTCVHTLCAQSEMPTFKASLDKLGAEESYHETDVH